MYVQEINSRFCYLNIQNCDARGLDDDCEDIRGQSVGGSLEATPPWPQLGLSLAGETAQSANRSPALRSNYRQHQVNLNIQVYKASWKMVFRQARWASYDLYRSLF